MKTARDLFLHELKDIYYAENKLAGELKEMAQQVSDDQLSSAIEEHRGVTETQVRRLEQVFDIVGEQPQGEKCDGIDGLVREFKSFVSENPSPRLIDLFATGAGVKVELYEMAAYNSLIRLADQLGLSEAAEIFQTTLNEEEDAAHLLEQMNEKLGQEIPTR
jgi:ferritin-like metal-binding protein YciE